MSDEKELSIVSDEDFDQLSYTDQGIVIASMVTFVGHQIARAAGSKEESKRGVEACKRDMLNIVEQFYSEDTKH